MTLLVAPNQTWPNLAAVEIARWQDIEGLIAVHHIGSTAIVGMPAKPVIDLLPVFHDSETQEAARKAVERMGYEWVGAHGSEGRAYARLDDPKTGKRRFQAHCYAQAHPDIKRHLAFRDALRQNAYLRAAYASVKAACAARHPDGGAAYGDCKSAWINKIEARALERGL